MTICLFRKVLNQVYKNHIKPQLENIANGTLTQNRFCLFSTNSMSSTSFGSSKCENHNIIMAHVSISLAGLTLIQAQAHTFQHRSVKLCVHSCSHVFRLSWVTSWEKKKW